MKRTLLVTVALCGLSLAAHAAQQKPVHWLTYMPGPQTCERSPLKSPSEAMAMVRRLYHVEATARDIDSDDGSIVAVLVYWPTTEFPDGMSATIRMFRTDDACEAYAKTQRGDPHKYD
jgi:hypothetical protein